MENGPDASRVRPLVHLPPLEYRLYNPDVDGRIPTPLDERGLVDAPELFQEIAKTVNPSYEWDSAFNDPHHLQWPNRWYLDEVCNPATKAANPHEFRNLAISKWILPRVLHNWIHKVAEPPPVPSNEVMFYRSEAQRVTTALFMTVRSGRRSIGSSRLTEKKIHAKLTPTYRDISQRLTALQAVPPEFRLIDLSEYHAGNVPDVLKIEAALGRCARINTADNALAIVRRANAA
ncbi:MAG: hypothetical protein ABI716_02720 [Candidatus Saccharibacteria bacterium]